MGTEIFQVLSPLLPRRCLLCFFLITSTGISIRAQSVRYELEQVPVTKELEGFYGTSILLGREGFIWLGSYQGPYRYDGTSFKRYFPDPSGELSTKQGSLGLMSDFVYSLIEDAEGTLWFSNFRVLTCFDRKAETFRHFYDTADYSGNNNSTITQVMYRVGMQSLSYFAQSFHKYYGSNPSEYRQSGSGRQVL